MATESAQRDLAGRFDLACRYDLAWSWGEVVKVLGDARGHSCGGAAAASFAGGPVTAR
jgi:hypothetical protein